MSAKEAFAEAAEHIAEARKLALEHLAPKEWPQTYNRLQLVEDTFNYLSATPHQDEPIKNPSSGPDQGFHILSEAVRRCQTRADPGPRT